VDGNDARRVRERFAFDTGSLIVADCAACVVTLAA
jgi:hypothetical protein